MTLFFLHQSQNVFPNRTEKLFPTNTLLFFSQKTTAHQKKNKKLSYSCLNQCPYLQACVTLFKLLFSKLLISNLVLKSHWLFPFFPRTAALFVLLQLSGKATSAGAGASGAGLWGVDMEQLPLSSCLLEGQVLLQKLADEAQSLKLKSGLLIFLLRVPWCILPAIT